MNVDPELDKPMAWTFPPSLAVYQRLFPSLQWQSPSHTLIVQELENRRSKLTLAAVPYDSLPSLSREGWVRPIDAWFNVEQLSPYSPQALSLATLGGRLTAIPDDITPFVFFIRKTVLDRLHIGPPRTWEEFGVMADLLVRSGQSLLLSASAQRSRMGFLLALLGSNGVAADSAGSLLKASSQMVEAYDWLWDRLITPGLLSADDLIHPNTGRRPLRGYAGGFGWLSDMESLPSDQINRYVFLQFPRGPSLGPDVPPYAPFKGSCWCIPWSKEPPDAAVAVLRSIHDRSTLQSLRIAAQRPFLATRSVWGDPAVRRRFPFYQYAAALLNGVVPMLSASHEHYRRLEVTFRNALLDRLSGDEWMDDYTGADRVSRRHRELPIRTVLQTIELLSGSVRGTGEIALSLRIHPTTLRRLFQREMREGITPYFRRRKMEKARELLQEQGLMTKEVAALTGYRNADAFTRAYSKFWGIPPTVDRKFSTSK